MCFTVTSTKIRKADRDIICFKYLYVVSNMQHDFSSYHTGFKYKAGFHYFNDNFPKLVRRNSALGREGLHSFINVKMVRGHVENVYLQAIECYIPKGAKYLVNWIDDEYMSSDLVIVGKLTKERYNELRKRGDTIIL